VIPSQAKKKITITKAIEFTCVAACSKFLRWLLLLHFRGKNNSLYFFLKHTTKTASPTPLYEGSCYSAHHRENATPLPIGKRKILGSSGIGVEA
jgi:hypothetical protein